VLEDRTLLRLVVVRAETVDQVVVVEHVDHRYRAVSAAKSDRQPLPVQAGRPTRSTGRSCNNG
jgi:hypothetical protein